VVLLASFELHLGRLDQTIFTQDAVDSGLRDAEALVVGDPGSQLTAAQLRKLSRDRQDSSLLLWGEAVPRR
jgi:hypothetical protein